MSDAKHRKDQDRKDHDRQVACRRAAAQLGAIFPSATRDDTDMAEPQAGQSREDELRREVPPHY